MIEGLSHVGTDHKCTICQCDFTDDEGGIQGYLGILPVAFCPTCFAGLCDLMEQLDDREWEGLTEEELYEIYDESDDGSSPCGVCGACSKCKIEVAIARAIEAKLKEKNT